MGISDGTLSKFKKSASALVTVTNLSFSSETLKCKSNILCRILDGMRHFCCIFSDDGDDFEYDTPKRAYMKILFGFSSGNTLWAGREIEIIKRGRVIGKIKIDKVLKPSLDRDSIADNAERLQNPETLNRAFGAAVARNSEKNPLDCLFIRLFTDFSGNDIRRLCIYTEKVKYNIFKKIYYKNYNPGSDKIGIDAEKEIRKLYPWISGENLALIEKYAEIYAELG